VQVLVGIRTENDSSVRLLSWSSPTGWGMLGMVVRLLIATEWMVIARPAWAVRTVTVPC
jgi:hypothetical protein